jgi:hypothetical protein
MTTRIQTYQDLLDEKERLQALLKIHKATLRQDIEGIKEEIAPLRSAVSFVSKLVTKKDSSFLVDAGISALVNVGVKRLVLARAGWVIRLIVPMILKNFSSHVVAENKNKIMKKLFSWIGKKNANGQAKGHEHHG